MVSSILYACTVAGKKKSLCSSEVDLNVKNEFLFREIHNIIATIHGQYEKGQFL